ncbi:uncharacterized protein [Antedon mediterranea]|uniref:uncharacterized protein n=1 Tax=Antedon mediterranea TaxID=105859 RepID=UPI003AF4E28A
MPRSISGDSVASTVFYLQDEYGALPPGPIKTCCLRCAFPTLLTFILLIIGVVISGTFFMLSGAEIIGLVEEGEGEQIFVDVPADLYDSLISWYRILKWVVGCEVSVMVVISIVMLALGYLATGSVRKEFMCRFKSKTSGRCQIAVFMVILYILWLIWLVQSVLVAFPVSFFYVFERMCDRDLSTVPISKCLVDLNLVGLTDDTACLNREDVRDICESNSLIYTGVSLAACLLVLFALTQLLINNSANYSHLRSRYKKIYNGRNSGTYTLTRTGSIRNSRRNLSGSRSTVAATGMVANPNFAPEKLPYSIMGSERNSFRSAVVNDGYVHDTRHRNGGLHGGGSGSASVVGYGGHANHHHDTNTLGHDSIALSSLRAPSTIHDMNTLGHDSIAMSSLRAPSTHSGSTGVDYGGNVVNLANMHASSDRLMYRTEYAV